MILRALREYFLGCPLLSGRSINVNFLGEREGDCSIDPIGTFTVERSYCDGKRVLSQDFCLGMRCAFDENTRMNLQDADFLERVALWIEQQNVIGNMPSFSGDMTALRLSVKKMPHLYESSVQGARMQIEFTLLYREN